MELVLFREGTVALGSKWKNKDVAQGESPQVSVASPQLHLHGDEIISGEVSSNVALASSFK